MSDVELELLHERHCETVAGLANDPLISKTSGVPPCCDVEKVREWVELNRFDEDGLPCTKELAFAVRKGGDVVGLCALKKLDLEKRKAELTYWVGSEHWGQGVATSASNIICRFAFDELELETLESHFLKENNKASGRILEKLGFVADTNREDLPAEDRYLEAFGDDVWTFVTLPKNQWQKPAAAATQQISLQSLSRPQVTSRS